MTDFLQPTEREIERIRDGLRLKREADESTKPVVRRRTCPHCDPTARAMDYARDQWIAAGIDRD